MTNAIERKAEAALREKRERREAALTRAKVAGGLAAVGLVLSYLPLISLLAYPAFAGAVAFAWLTLKKLVKE